MNEVIAEPNALIMTRNARAGVEIKFFMLSSPFGHK
jgi:hypothetical protein